jgi:predicted glycogen debranching enzyme
VILAADQFIVPRGSNRSVIAGYHWFTDWGRDTMISLPGLCLATKRFEDAQRILLAYSESVSQGMLPNRFPDHGEPPEYNTVDATLWFFVAAQKYWDQTGDVTFLRETLLPVLRDIVAWHDRGTRHGIRVDADGLLTAGGPGDQLTWMDARVGGEPVTPRYGKPVEVNALWYNALRILSGFERRSGSPDSARDLAARADAVAEQFRRLFWNEDAGCLYDVIRPDGADASIRPNQIFALTLPFPLLEEPQASSVLKVVEERLLTPRGLRTLAPDDPKFIGRFGGPPSERDRAYHQGMVWPFLLGPYISALVRLRGERGRAEALRIVVEFEPHLAEAGVGTISEIFDPLPPYTPRGCIAQAWSVGELLSAMSEDLGIAAKRRPPVSEKSVRCD